MTELRKVKIVDKDGNYIESHQDVDGEYYLASALIQAVHLDPNNSSTDNLDSSNNYTFEGEATSTLGVAALQWTLKTDQNAMVYIEQSQEYLNPSADDSDWQIIDSYKYYYTKGGFGETVQAIASYWRIRVVLTGTTPTTFFNLQAVLCPIADPLPRSLNPYGRLITSSTLEDPESGTYAEVDPLGSLKTITPVRFIGTGFEGTVLDTNFWTSTATLSNTGSPGGSGTVTQAGELILDTGTTANSEIEVNSVRRARKVPGSTNQFRAVARLITDAQADNIRRLGAYDTNDGFFFQIDGTTFGVGSRKGGSDNIINSGSFNGNYGASVTMDTLIKRLVIDYTALSAKFYVNGVLLHTIVASTESNTNTLTLPIRMENNNINGNVTDNQFEVRFASILRLGLLITNPQYFYTTSATVGAGKILKRGAGTLQRIVNNDNAGSITIYDDISAVAANLIATIDATKALGLLEYEAPFSNGLFVTVTGSPVLTIIYE